MLLRRSVVVVVMMVVFGAKTAAVTTMSWPLPFTGIGSSTDHCHVRNAIVLCSDRFCCFKILG